MSDLKEIKQTIVSYEPHSPCIKEMMKTWASSTKATAYDGLQLISVVLDNGPQLLWKYYWREETKILEQRGKAKGFEMSQNQILGEGHYSDP